MTLLTKAISGIVIASGIGFIATPIIYQKQINKVIQTQKQILAKKDISISKTKNNDSFFCISREYILTIKDITPFIKELYPNARPYMFRKYSSIFNNTQLLVTLDFSKYPISHKDAIKISLYKFNKNVTNNLENDYAGKELLSFIQKKGLEIILDTDALNISKAKLKDINLMLHKNQNSKDTAFLEIKKAYIIFRNKTYTNINKINFVLNNKQTKTDIELDNIKYNYSKQNNFNYKTNSSIQKISYTFKSYFNNKKQVNLTLQNLSSSSNVNAIVNKLNISNSMNIKNFQLQSGKDIIKLNNFTFNNKIDKLDLISIKKIVNITQNSKKIEPSQILPYLQTLINKGFSFKISPISLDSAIINIQNKKFNISKIDLNLITNLETNDFTFNSNPNILLNYISANLHITTTKENINLITKLNPMIPVYLAMVSTQNKNKVNIDISYKNGKLTSNGKKLF